MKKADKQVIFLRFTKEIYKKIEKGKAFPLGSAASVFATTPSPRGQKKFIKKIILKLTETIHFCPLKPLKRGRKILKNLTSRHFFVDFMCFIYLNYKDVFKVFLVYATRIVAPAKQSTVSETKPSAEDER